MSGGFVGRIKNLFDWLVKYGFTLWIGYYLIQSDIDMLKEVWSVAQHISYDNFVTAIVVGAGIIAVVRLAAKRWPKLNNTGEQVISRVLEFVWPYVERVAPYVGRFFVAIWRNVLFPVVSFIWRRMLRPVFSLIWRVLKAMTRPFRGRPSSRPKRTYYHTHDHDHEDDDDDDSRSWGSGFSLRRFLRDNYFILPLYVSMAVGLNEDLNRPGQTPLYQLLKIGALLFILLLLGLRYRTLLGLFLWDCFLWWASATEGVKAGTVYMFMSVLAFLLWLAYKHYVLNRPQEEPAQASADDEGDKPESDDSDADQDGEEKDSPEGSDDKPDDDDPPDGKKEG